MASQYEVVNSVVTTLTSSAHATAYAAVASKKADVIIEGKAVILPHVPTAADLVPGVVGAPPRGYGIPPQRRALRFGRAPPEADDMKLWDYFDRFRDAIEIVHGRLPDLSPYTLQEAVGRYRLAAQMTYIGLGVLATEGLTAENLPRSKEFLVEAKDRFAKFLPPTQLEGVLKKTLSYIQGFVAYDTSVSHCTVTFHWHWLFIDMSITCNTYNSFHYLHDIHYLLSYHTHNSVHLQSMLECFWKFFVEQEGADSLVETSTLDIVHNKDLVELVKVQLRYVGINTTLMADDRDGVGFGKRIRSVLGASDTIDLIIMDPPRGNEKSKSTFNASVKAVVKMQMHVWNMPPPTPPTLALPFSLPPPPLTPPT
jgi:hypothetical protein